MRVRRGRVGAAVAAVLLLGGLSACGGDDKNAGDGGELEAPLRGPLNNEDVLADPSVVAEGLGVVKDQVRRVMEAFGSNGAVEENGAIADVWDSIEGRIKSEDPAAHAQFDTQFAALSAAVGAKDRPAAQTAADALTRLADDYLAGKRLPPPTTAAVAPSATALPSSSATTTPAATASTTSPSPAP
ncbi:MAG: hypothetical protein ACT4QG_02160 [Sporichthyaceae bacterium]